MTMRCVCWLTGLSVYAIVASVWNIIAIIVCGLTLSFDLQTKRLCVCVLRPNNILKTFHSNLLMIATSVYKNRLIWLPATPVAASLRWASENILISNEHFAVAAVLLLHGNCVNDSLLPQLWLLRDTWYEIIVSFHHSLQLIRSAECNIVCTAMPPSPPPLTLDTKMNFINPKMWVFVRREFYLIAFYNV